MMASARKKLDEKHLKVLRMLASSNSNKYCFDCHQRGPTYVNVTIGSFVCTKCSGILRGLTPPHRVKSISMATFTQEEVDQLMTKGNEYCQKVWLALCETDAPTKDEQQIKDFMIEKYEKKRYYVEPSIAMKMSSLNGINNSSQNNSTPSPLNPISSNMTSNLIIRNKSEVLVAPPPSDNNNSKLYMNGNAGGLSKTPKPITADPFQPANQTQPSFANFDNAPIFSATSTVPDNSNNKSGLVVIPPPQSYTPPASTCIIRQRPINFEPSFSNISQMNRWSTGSLIPTPVSAPCAIPTEDRYAALKDLDSQMKSQNTSNGSLPKTTQEPILPSQPTPAQPDPWGSTAQLVGTPPTNGMWNSSYVAVPKEPISNGFTCNPFANDNWGNENGVTNGEVSNNPFKSSKLFSDWPASNGNSEMTTSQSFGNFPWMSNNQPNPFAVGGLAGSPTSANAYHSSNPFL